MTTTEKAFPGISGLTPAGNPELPLEVEFRKAAAKRKLRAPADGDLPGPIKVALGGIAQMMDFCAQHLAEDPEGLRWFASACSAWATIADAAAKEAQVAADEAAAAQAAEDQRLADEAAAAEQAKSEQLAAEQAAIDEQGSESGDDES